MVTRDAAVAALLPCRSRKRGHGVSVSACPGTARSAGCHEPATVGSIPRISGCRASGSASRHFTRRGGQLPGAVARQRGRCGAAAHAVGGGRPNTSGTMESGARNIAANSAGRSRLRWRAVRTTLARTCWVSAPLRVRLPPHTLRVTTAGRMACSARQLVASTDGSHRKVKMAGNSMARWAAKRSVSSSGGGLSISRLSRASSRPRAVARPWSAQVAGVAPVA